MPQKLTGFVALSTIPQPRQVTVKWRFAVSLISPPYVFLVKNDIEQGKELCYDYGDEENM